MDSLTYIKYRKNNLMLWMMILLARFPLGYQAIQIMMFLYATAVAMEVNGTAFLVSITTMRIHKEGTVLIHIMGVIVSAIEITWTKILCFMWGHHMEEKLHFPALREFFCVGGCGPIVRINVCKHCGAHKHD
ncbi:hypothetical protein [Nitrosomonas sp.]|uniref:hypothetical protein n=1 Tax=Nitrosomonas sp. TaxID=42353 RepID=UPI0025EFB979|nr:hypothetical protein [Nitrosomonas sp.]MBY0483477.1 hypothetical protein [Nitrosomonas sp.]